ncbi:MAG: CPBP family intramembrane metalloprotease [Candidatus Marinimicrobia bacterium]|nr:CPBP family intramembrane metalloprotease [Candidatus Neomarinimicrobiota bacterium]
MDILSLRTLLFLTYLLVFLPLMAFRSRNKIIPASGGVGTQYSSLKAIWFWTLFNHGVLFLLAWLASQEVSFKPFSMPAIDLIDGLYAIAALSVCVAISSLVRSSQSAREAAKEAITHWLLPRSMSEAALKSLTVLTASVVEEVAYRGVGYYIIWQLFGNPWLAAVVCSIAFGLAHWVQGWKNVVGIIAIGAVLQGLVVATNTLFLAIAVHVVFDIVAIIQAKREAR